MHDLAEHRFIELHEVGAFGREIRQFLAQDRDHIVGHGGLVRIGGLGVSGDPHRARQQVRPGKRGFDRAIGQRPHEPQVIGCQRGAATQSADAGRVANGEGRSIQRLQLSSKAALSSTVSSISASDINRVPSTFSVRNE